MSLPITDVAGGRGPATPVAIILPDGSVWNGSGGGGGSGGAVEVTNWPTNQAVSGPLTNDQLRAAAVPVSGPLTNAQFIAALSGAAYTDATGAANGSIASLLKGLFVAISAQNALAVEMKGLLEDIKTNTTPAP